MGCGCRKNRSTDSRTSRSSTSTIYEVFVNGESTGRKFSSLVGAQSYAAKVNGEIRAI